MAINLTHLANIIRPYIHDNSLWVAYSGGLDSHVLIHLMKQLHDNGALPQPKVIHINHHLHPQATQWQQHCQKTCEQLALPFTTLDVKPARSTEQAARIVRYQAFCQRLLPHDILLLAHHQQDQAETFLLHSLRGSGPTGLAAMKTYRRHQHIQLLRPLLDFPKSVLKQYATMHGLNSIDDESNADTRFDRNFIRHRIMPLLEERWPHASQSFAQSAQLCHDEHQILTQHLQQTLSTLLLTKNRLCIKKLLDLTPAKQHGVIRLWYQQQGLNTPNRQHLQQLIQTIVLAKSDAQPRIIWEKHTITRYQDTLCMLNPHANLPLQTATIQWDDLCAPISLPGHHCTLTLSLHPGLGLIYPKPHQKVSIRFRQGRERFRPHQRCGSHPLKKLMQEWRIPPWERSHIPLIYYDESLVCVVGYALSHDMVTHSSGYQVRQSPIKPNTTCRS